MKFSDTFTEIVKADIATGATPALMGEPGIGKSSFVEDLAEEMGTRAFTLNCGVLADKADLTGARLVPYEKNGTTEYQQVFFPHQMITQAIDYAEANPRETPILFMDEINRSNADVTSAGLSMTTERTIGSKKLPANLRIVIAGNTKGNVTALDEASLSRFAIYHVEPDAATLVQILGDAINPCVKKVLTEHPETVFDRSRPTVLSSQDGPDDDDQQVNVDISGLLDSSEDMRQLTTPRTIEKISKWLNHIDDAKLNEYLATASAVGDRQITVLQEIFEAHLGDTDFTTYLLAAVADQLSTAQSSSPKQLAAARPQVFDDLKSAQNLTELETTISGMTEREHSAALLYALFEKDDNTRLIDPLAQAVSATGSMQSEHTQQLVQLAAAHLLDDANVDALAASGAPVAAQLTSILNAFS